MGFDDCRLFGEQTASFISSAIGQMGHSAGAASHAIGELSKALNGYSHAEGYSSLPCRQSTVKNVIMMSIVRKPLLKIDGIKNATLTIDSEKIDWNVLEKNFGPWDRGDIVFYK